MLAPCPAAWRACGAGSGPSICSTPAPAAPATRISTQNQASARAASGRRAATGEPGGRSAAQRCARFCTAIAFSTVQPCCSWKSVSGLVASKVGQFSGGSLGMSLRDRRQVGARRRRRGLRRAALVAQRRGSGPPRAPARNAAARCGSTCTSTSGVMPSPWMRAAGGRVVARRGQPHGAVARQRDHGLHRALAEAARADQHRPVLVLQRAGDDLAGRGRAAVDQHHQRQAAGDVAAGLAFQRWLSSGWRARVETISPWSRKSSDTATAWSSSPPGLLRRSSTMPLQLAAGLLLAALRPPARRLGSVCSLKLGQPDVADVAVIEPALHHLDVDDLAVASRPRSACPRPRA